MELTERVQAYIDELERDAPEMGELLPEGEVLASVAERLRQIVGDERL